MVLEIFSQYPVFPTIESHNVLVHPVQNDDYILRTGNVNPHNLTAQKEFGVPLKETAV